MNTIPVEQRVLIDLETAANLTSVSTRTMKREAVAHPELVVQLGRRRLFNRERLMSWIAAGCPAPKLPRR